MVIYQDIDISLDRIDENPPPLDKIKIKKFHKHLISPPPLPFKLSILFAFRDLRGVGGVWREVGEICVFFVGGGAETKKR